MPTPEATSEATATETVVDTGEAPAADPTSAAEIEKFAAELDAAAGEETPAEKPADAPAEEKPAEPATEEKPPEQAAVDADVKRARAILAAAAKAQAKAGEMAKKATGDLIAEFKASPSKFLERAGMSVDDFLIAAAGEGEPAKPATETDRIAALEKRLADSEKANKDAEEKRQKADSDAKDAAHVEGLKAKIHADVKAAAAKFPRITRGDAAGLVTDTMLAYHAKHGTPLSWDKAAEQVEGYLASLAGEEAKPSKAAAPFAPRPGTKTLTNDATREAPPTDEGLSMDPDIRLKQIAQELERADRN